MRKIDTDLLLELIQDMLDEADDSFEEVEGYVFTWNENPIRVTADSGRKFLITVTEEE